MKPAGAAIAFALLFAAAAPSSAQAPSEPSAPEGESPAEASDGWTATVEHCVSEHERARIARVHEQWLEARAAMTVCSSESCPIAIRSDCRAWLDELSQTLPTLLVVVERDDGASTPVRLELDGRAAEALDPSHPVQLLPGTHHLRFSLDGYAPVESDITVEKGEKNRLVNVRFAHEPAPAPPAFAPAPPVTPVATRPIPVASYALAGGAVVAFATSTALLVSALSMRADARATCAPVCEHGVRSSIDTRLLFSDISAAAGLTLAGLCAYTFFKRPVVYATAAPAPGGATLSFSGRF